MFLKRFAESIRHHPANNAADDDDYEVPYEYIEGGATDDDSNDNDNVDAPSPRHIIKSFHIDEDHCPKMIKMYNDSQKFDGIKCFYFRLTKTYGCDTMEKLLIKEGYTLANPIDALSKPGKRYVLFTGKISQERYDRYCKIYEELKEFDKYKYM